MGRYAIFNGLVYGGGTAVIPNPEGTPTDELHSIQIDEDIYEIVGGGGSGGNASLDATTLYDTPITSTGTYTLADDYNNYDFIGFKAGNGSTETDIRLYAVKDIQDSMNDNLVITNNVTNAWFNFTINENELTIPGKTVSTIYSVIGYKIKGGGENSNVEANPAGTPTDTLSTIGIDGTIYNIEGSGGSGSSFVMDELYTGTSEVPSSGSTVSLSKSIDNYDFIMFDIGQNTEHTHQFFTPDTLNDSTNECLLFSTNGYCDVYASTSTELTFGNRNSFSSRQLYGVYGIKIGCGGGSSTNVQRLSPEAYNALPQSEKENGTIYFVHQDAGETTISGTFTTGSTQYEKVIVDCGFKPTSISVILPFSNGDTYAEYDEAVSTTTSTWEIPMESRTYTITLGSETGESGITDILDNGFKFRCNASNTRNVNCTFEATGVLDNEINKIYYMGNEYTNGSSSGGGGSQELISYDTTITTTQYGWWTAEDKDGNVLDPDKYELIAVTPIVNNSPSWTGAWDGAFFVNTVDGVTYRYDVTFVNINDGGYIRTSRTWDVKVIYRDKNAAGGGGGSTVVPNPQEEPTDTLNTVEIDGTIYDIKGSGGGDGYKLEKIFDGNVTTTGNITLNKSISNYDELLFVLNFKSIPSESYIRTFNVDVSIFKNIGNYTATRGVLLNDWSRDTRYAQVKYVDDTTIDVDAIQVVSIVEIYGVKLEGSSGGTSEGEGVEIYSEDEYIVGKWIDGKKLYQRTFSLPSAIILQANDWTTINNVVVQDANRCIQTDVYLGADDSQSSVFGKFSNGVLSIFSDIPLSINAVTVRYTKTVETPAPAWGGSVTNNYANFIDTDNVIYSTVSSSASDTYIATEDCYIMQDVIVGTNVATVQIDGETVAEYSFSGTQLLSYNAYLKKGQTITVTHGATSAHTIKVFGISYGSGGSSSGNKIEYSTEEKEIGTWTDGKPIYEKIIINDNLTDTSTVPHAMYIGNIPNDVDIILPDLSVSVCDSTHRGWVTGGGICTVSGWNFGLHITDNKVVLYGDSASAIQGGMAIVKIRYTKTTT